MKYIIEKTDVIDPSITSAEWNKANTGTVGCQRWSEFYQPITTTFKLLRGPEGISVLMHTDEKNLLADKKVENGLVCEDSCMEFFFKPDVLDVNYFNFEVNPGKYMYVSVGNGREDRTMIEERDMFSVESIPNDGDWTVKYYIPDKFIYKYFNKISPVCKGNFYKCGELTGHSHFITWSEVEVLEPDFHVPDFFGKLEFSK